MAGLSVLGPRSYLIAYRNVPKLRELPFVGHGGPSVL
jgi:hypothetical protein